jgi:hypothetical protein
MGIFGNLRGGAGQPAQPAQKTQFNTGGMARPMAPASTAPAPRTFETDSRGLNKMPSIESLGAPKSGFTVHSTPKGASSPLRHEVTSYGDMHTVNTFGQTPQGEQHIGSFMTDRAPSLDKGSFGFGGGNTFDMATGQQAPSGAYHENAQQTREWKN